jgi:hypothetical protein
LLQQLPHQDPLPLARRHQQQQQNSPGLTNGMPAFQAMSIDTDGTTPLQEGGRWD